MLKPISVAGHHFTVILNPDPDGGFTAQCREKPAAISHGATEQEALENIADALNLCLEIGEEVSVCEANDHYGRPLRDNSDDDGVPDQWKRIS